MMASSTEVGHLKEQQDRIIKLAFGLPPLIETRDWKEGTKKVSSKWEWKPSLNHSFSSWKRKVESKENNQTVTRVNVDELQETVTRVNVDEIKRDDFADEINAEMISADEMLTDNFMISADEMLTDNFIPPIKTSVISYTDAEYESHLQNLNWNKEETDLLMELCSTFHLNWFVVADRLWEETGQSKSSVQDVGQKETGQSKSVEDVRQRYYQVNRLLLNARNTPQEALLFSYDALKDMSTRSNLQTLLGRSPEYLQQEDMLMCEVIKAQRNLAEWSQQRELLYSIHSFNQSSRATAEKSFLKKKRGVGLKGKRDKDDDLIKKDIMDSITLSSSHIPLYKPAVQAKIQACLEEFGVGLRPKYATGPILKIFEQIVSAAHSLVSTRKLQERIQHDLKIAKMNKKTLVEGKSSIATNKKRSLSSAFASDSPSINSGREHKKSRGNI